MASEGLNPLRTHASPWVPGWIMGGQTPAGASATIGAFGHCLRGLRKGSGQLPALPAPTYTPHPIPTSPSWSSHPPLDPDTKQVRRKSTRTWLRRPVNLPLQLPALLSSTPTRYHYHTYILTQVKADPEALRSSPKPPLSTWHPSWPRGRPAEKVMAKKTICPLFMGVCI